MNIFHAKINFFKLKNLSSHIQNGKEDETTLNRISELKKGIEKITKMSLKAKEQKKKMTISSEIIISFSEN
jgi:threonyl-tRNA synthetase